MTGGSAASSKRGQYTRKEKREPKRLRVRYGVNTADKNALSRNLSENGLYLETSIVYKPGTHLRIEIDTPRGGIQLVGKVAWARRVPEQLSHVLDCGMGVTLVDAGPDWIAFIRSRNPLL